MRKIAAFLLIAFLTPMGANPVLAKTETRYLSLSKQELLDFEKEIQRVALSDESVITFELISSRQLLVQARKAGHTNLLVWFKSGEVQNIDYSVGSAARPMEEIISKAMQALEGGIGKNVTVSRIVRGSYANDDEDLLILEGKVRNQVALTRVLSVAAFIVAGSKDRERHSIRAVADESGALLAFRESSATSQDSSSGQIFRAGAGSGSGGGSRGLQNRIGKSIGRAKIVEGADGRLLSFIEVEDIPRVRVAIRILQVDRSKLKEYGSSLTVIGSDRASRRLNRIELPQQIGDSPEPNLTATSGLPEFQTVIHALSGAFTGQAQYAAANFALDAVLSTLESDGITETLAEPTLNVLSGETAVFIVGGQVPIPAATATTAVVFNAIEFQDFGVELSVRPLVEEDDTIVLDVAPRVSDPVTNTFSSVTNAPAFETKALKTTARVQDGQSLVTAGLIKRTRENLKTKTPRAASIPLLGWFFRGVSNSDDDTEMVVIVTPTIERDPIPDLDLWKFPSGQKGTSK